MTTFAPIRQQQNNTNAERLMIGVLAIASAPIGFRVAGIEVAALDLMLPVLAVLAASRLANDGSLRAEIQKHWRRALLVVALAVVSWAYIGIRANRVSVSDSFLTMAFFLRSFLAVPICLTIIRAASERARRQIFWLLPTHGAIVAIPALLSDLPIRIETRTIVGARQVTRIAGDWLGFELFGDGQVNTFALYFALAASASALIAFDSSRRPLGRVIAAGFAIANLVVVLEAGSRTGLLVIAVWALLALKRMSNNWQNMLITILGVFVVVSLSPVLASVGVPVSISQRLQIDFLVVESSDLNQFSNGRLELVEVLVSDVSRSPLFGTGFADFELFHAGDETFTGSPHNQWIGTMHKMGLIGAAAYIVFFWGLARGSRGSNTSIDLVRAALVGSLAIDALTVPITAVAIALLIGLSSEPARSRSRTPSLANKTPARAPTPLGSRALPVRQ